MDNVRDEDWTGVSLSLVSGTPISFIQTGQGGAPEPKAKIWVFGARSTLKPGVNRLTLECQDAENTLMNTPERLALNESLQSFNSKSELPQR